MEADGIEQTVEGHDIGKGVKDVDTEQGPMAVASPSPSTLTSPWRLGSAPPRRHIAGEAEEESGGLDGEGHGGAAVPVVGPAWQQ